MARAATARCGSRRWARASRVRRWAQGHRSVDSLRAAGRAGFAATVRRYGRAFAADVLARRRLAHSTAPERRMIGLLDDLRQREGTDYAREYPVVPGHLYADFAWPERQLAVEVYGDAHTAEWFVERGIRLGVVPPARIAGGPYDGGWVVSADDEDGRVYFAVPAAALPLLRDALEPETYTALSRQAAMPGVPPSRRTPGGSAARP
ncbi:MAG TPA: hypothetical protein VFW96_15060 [Thermomicrobiales bacterium]|nr:hypothetical protein [Thermomicrobiales bacterium]